MTEEEEVQRISNRIHKNIQVFEDGSIRRKIFLKNELYDIIQVDENDNTFCIILGIDREQIVFLCESEKEQYIKKHKHPFSKKIFFVLKGGLEINGQEVDKGEEYVVDKNTLHDILYKEKTRVFIRLMRQPHEEEKNI